jgi:hypothetical protein
VQVPAVAARLRRREFQVGAGGALSVAVAAGFFGWFGINGLLSRDESIYVYSAQRLAHGTPPYASIFDPKTPLASFVGGIAAALARALGRNDLYAIRAAFFLCALLTVAAIYALSLQLFRSVIGATVAGVVFACFNGFAKDALSGPDAKTPGILCAVIAMWFIARRSYTWAAGFGALAFLAWQPLLIYALLPIVLAAVVSEPGRRRTSALWAAFAAAVPVAATALYFAATGAFGDFVESTIAYPFTGVEQGPESFARHFTVIAGVVTSAYRFSGALLWAGMLAVVVLSVRQIRQLRPQRWQMLADPWLAAVFVTFAFEGLYAIYDFQGYPDVFPLLPYGAVGLGAVAALVMGRAAMPEMRVRTAVAIVTLLAILAGLSFAWFKPDEKGGVALRAQQADACAVQRLLPAGGHLYALGDPTFLVLTHRVGPSRFIYLEAGVDKWKVDHTRGGLAAWEAQIVAMRPDIIAVGGWYRTLHDEMTTSLRDAGYLPRYLGTWRVLLGPGIAARARVAQVRLTNLPTPFATGREGRELPASGC